MIKHKYMADGEDEDDEESRFKSNSQYQRFVIKPTTWFYTFWSITEGIVMIMSAILYPYCAAFDFSVLNHGSHSVIYFSEFLALTGIILNFFLAYKEEGSLKFE